jgi:hypothetical protein
MENCSILAPVFHSEYEYIALDDSQLSLQVGDVIAVQLMDDDSWWYGTNEASQHGWFPASYGYCEPKFTEQIICGLNRVYNKMVSSEENFTHSLESFISTIIQPLEIRDTPFKRSLISECALALSFNLMSELLACSLSLLKSLRNVDILSDDGIGSVSFAACITHFAPTLRLFSQYIAENSNALNELKAHASGLRRFLRDYSLPPDTSLESYLVMPVIHYGHYMIDVDDIIFYSQILSRVNSRRDVFGEGAGYGALGLLEEAREILRVYAMEADYKLHEERKKQILLAIQSQCE